MERGWAARFPGGMWMAKVQILVLLVFVPAKAVRPQILAADAPHFVDIFFLSFPNFCEGIVGPLVLTIIIGFLRQWIWPKMADWGVYVAAVLLAAVFVITQEMRLHDLGGNNVYDPYDVAASLIGLLVAFGLLMWRRPLYTRTAS